MIGSAYYTSHDHTPFHSSFESDTSALLYSACYPPRLRSYSVILYIVSPPWITHPIRKSLRILIQPSGPCEVSFHFHITVDHCADRKGIFCSGSSTGVANSPDGKPFLILSLPKTDIAAAAIRTIHLLFWSHVFSFSLNSMV